MKTAAVSCSAKRTTCPPSSWTSMPTCSSSSASPSACISARKSSSAHCGKSFPARHLRAFGFRRPRQRGLPPEKGVLWGEVPDEVIIEENGIRMSVDVKNGQKTGYFLDQKENRFAIRRYAAGGKVLDCFCNSGGFALNAALTAERVIAADISPLALKNVERNAALNGISNVETVCDDVFRLLREYRAKGEKFSLVVLDPPAFCKSAAEVKDAYRGYKDINIQAMKLTERGGFLATCSCSQHMTPPPVRQDARRSRKGERAAGAVPGIARAGARSPRSPERGRDEIPQIFRLAGAVRKTRGEICKKARKRRKMQYLARIWEKYFTSTKENAIIAKRTNAEKR